MGGGEELLNVVPGIIFVSDKKEVCWEEVTEEGVSWEGDAWEGCTQQGVT